MYSRAEFEAETAVIEAQQSFWRRMVIAGAEPGNPWRYDGLVVKDRLDYLDRELARCERRLRMSAVNAGLARQERAAKITKGGFDAQIGLKPRTRLGYFWKRLPNEELARKLRQSGFEVRFVGVGWEARVS